MTDAVNEFQMAAFIFAGVQHCTVMQHCTNYYVILYLTILYLMYLLQQIEISSQIRLQLTNYCPSSNAMKDTECNKLRSNRMLQCC